MTLGSHYSEPFDMEGSTTLRVEARHLGEAPAGVARATLQVEGTNDEAQKKSWAEVGGAIDLPTGKGVVEKRMQVPRTVRAVVGGEGRFDVRFYPEP